MQIYNNYYDEDVYKNYKCSVCGGKVYDTIDEVLYIFGHKVIMGKPMCFKHYEEYNKNNSISKWDSNNGNI